MILQEHIGVSVNPLTLNDESFVIKEQEVILLYRVGHEKVARLPFARVLVTFSLWHLWYSLWR
jgi:hypothetical protein